MSMMEHETIPMEGQVEEVIQEQPKIVEEIVLEELAVDGICGIY